MSKNFVFYLAVLALFGTGIYTILSYGSRLQSAPAVASASATPHAAAAVKAAAPANGMFRALLQNAKSPLSTLLLQVVLIVVAARGLGSLFRKIKQPPVIGEMMAGILLGPSLLGMLAPQAQGFLFPAASM